jgi:hypothetical protein
MPPWKEFKHSVRRAISTSSSLWNRRPASRSFSCPIFQKSLWSSCMKHPVWRALCGVALSRQFQCFGWWRHSVQVADATRARKWKLQFVNSGKCKRLVCTATDFFKVVRRCDCMTELSDRFAKLWSHHPTYALDNVPAWAISKPLSFSQQRNWGLIVGS